MNPKCVIDKIKKLGIVPDKSAGEMFSFLVGVVDRLRGENGCPWDKEQKEDDVKEFLLEEVYELVSAIDSSDTQEIIEEIGDVLLLCVFLTRIYKEKGLFDLIGPLGEVIDKLIRRHPHVFGDTAVDSADEVIKNWTKIKNQEKRIKGKKRVSVWDSVPKKSSSLFQYYTYLKERKKHNKPVNVEDSFDKLRAICSVKNVSAVDKDFFQQVLMLICEIAFLKGMNPEVIFLEKIDDMRQKDNS